jgi:2',3'-cyclic-nucleotide 2'-phosphodiesterase (5'-nucleotidase family)
MGLKNRTGGDDFANTVMALTSEFPEIVVFIAGHTHQDVPNRLTNGVLFTQADHFGIHVGRVDLLFDRNAKKLLRRQAICELMDNRLPLDATIISRAKPQLAESEEVLSEPIGELAETLRGRSGPGRPSDVEMLIGAAIMETLLERQIPIDGVMHGTFNDNADLVSGPKTVSDIWAVIPFENYIVTAQLFPDEIKSVMQEVFASHEKRNLLGFDVKIEGRGDDCRIVSMTLAGHELPDPSKKFTIAFNSFDARSGGHHFMKLRALLERPESKCVRHSVQTRDALIAYFQRHKIVRRVASLGPVAIAA